MRIAPVALASSLLAAALAGCATDLGGAGVEPVQTAVATQLARLESIQREPLVLELDVPIHVVFVGLDPAVVDVESIRSRLPTEYSPMDRIRSIVWEREFHEPLRYNISYDFTFATEAFAKGLFDAMAANAEEGPPTAYLCDYDKRTGHNRLSDHGPTELPCNFPGVLDSLKPVQYVSASAVEDWIHQNRAAHGLAFDRPSYTVFFLDSWTNGYLPKDGYHYLDYVEDLEHFQGARTLRTWGGTYDFAFLDLSAAPNNDGNDRSPTDKLDPPIWDYQGDKYVASGGPLAAVDTMVNGYPASLVLSDAVTHDLRMAIHMILLPSNLYHPTYASTYFLNVHVYQETEAIVQNGDIEADFDLNVTLDRLSKAIPWARFEGKATFYRLPDDDPGMQQAILQAKAEGAGTYVSTVPVKNYVNANLDKYLAGPEGAFNLKVFYFNFGGGYAFALPVVVGGIASANPDGSPWGVLGSHADLLVALGSKFDYGSLTAHEVGHFFGLNHPHDGVVIEDGEYRDIADYTWDATSTPLSYRMVPYGSNQLDRDLLSRAQTALLVNQALRNQKIAYEALAARGVDVTPADVHEKVVASQSSIDEAVRLFKAGVWEDAATKVDSIRLAIQAVRESEEAVRRAGGYRVVERVIEWDASGVNHVTHSTSAVDGEVSARIYYDYRKIEFNDTDDLIVVNVTWQNAPGSHGDFFAGWHYGTPPDRVELGILGGIPGVWDLHKEGPADAGSESFTLSLDDDGVRENGFVLAGAGTKRQSVNGAYHVKVTIVGRAYDG